MTRRTVRRTPAPASSASAHGQALISGFIMIACAVFALGMGAAPARADTDPIARGIAAKALNQPAGIPATCTATATQASILACRTQLLMTGGRILLPAATITLTSSLPVDSNIWYVGVGPGATGQSIDPGDLWNIANGTILQGDGTFPAFVGKNTPLGAPDDGTTSIFGWGLENVILSNFSYGVQVGATNSFGLFHSHIYNVFFTGITAWALDIEGAWGFDDIRNVYTKSSANCYHLVDSMPTATYNPANSWIQRAFCMSTGPTNRGLVLNAVNGGNMGSLEVHQYQYNGFSNSLFTQAATMANASTSITVTDGTKYRVGMPVTVTVTANGFTANQIYFVLSISGNVLTLGNGQNAAAISATGSTATSITSYGFGGLELTAVGGGFVGGSSFYDLDLEGGETCAVYLDGTSSIHIDLVAANPTTFAHVCGRTARFTQVWSTLASGLYDFDGPSFTPMIFGNRSTTVQRNGLGLYNDGNRGTNALMLSATGIGGTPDLESRPLSGASFIAVPASALGQKTSTGTGTSGTFDASNAGIYYYTGAADGTRALPTIVNSLVQTSNIGIPYWISNGSTHLLTITSAANQWFNGVTNKTSLLLQPGQMLLAWAVVDGGGNFRWATIISRDVMAASAAPTLGAGCGTGATVAGSDGAGTITAGTTPGSCVVTFTTIRPSAPHCSVTDQAGAVPAYSETTTALTLTPTASHVYDYQCAA